MKEWKTFILSRSDIDTGVPTPKGRSIMITLPSNETLIFSKKAFRQLQKLTGDRNYQIRAFRGEDGVWVGVIVGSEEFTPIPHRVLFDSVYEYLVNTGVKVLDREFKKWIKRTGMFFVLHHCPLSYARRGDAVRVGVLVTNANTARDSIRIYGFAEIVQCINGLTIHEASGRFVVHRGDVKEVLVKVCSSVREVVEWLSTRYDDVRKRIENLQFVDVSKEDVKIWIKEHVRRLPKKYSDWFLNQLEKNIRIFGYNKLALLQTSSYFATRFSDRSEEICKHMNAESRSIYG